MISNLSVEESKEESMEKSKEVLDKVPVSEEKGIRSLNFLGIEREELQTPSQWRKQIKRALGLAN